MCTAALVLIKLLTDMHDLMTCRCTYYLFFTWNNHTQVAGKNKVFFYSKNLC